MNTKNRFFAVLLLLFLFNIPAGANTFSSIFAFGDSLSDSGTNPSSVMSIFKLIGGQCDPFHPCPPYDGGRYSNGPNAIEYLADTILPGGGNTTNFFNYAVAGATSGIGNFGDGGSQSSPGSYGLPGMTQQIAKYLLDFSGNASNDSLYVIWGGANDFLTADSPISAAQNIAAYVGILAGIGAEHILVPNIPNLGMTPYIQSLGTAAIAAAEAFSLGFNQELAARLNALAPLTPTTNIAQFDTFSFFAAVAQNPAAYGFSNITDACINLPAVCANPDEHIFWDDFHPTTRMHALLASDIVSQVPLPSAILFFASGVLFFYSSNLRRKRI